MSLWTSKILYVFIDVTALRSQRTFFEEVLRLEVVEHQFHPPHHRHGVIKYDAGDVIVALNIADPDFDRNASDGIVMVFSAPPMREAQIYAELHINGYAPPTRAGDIFTDVDNRRYSLIRVAPPVKWEGEERACLRELHLDVEDMSQSRAFYEEALGLVMFEQTPATTAFATGNVKLVLRELSPSESQAPSRHKGNLIVFHTENINETYEKLSKRGVNFQGQVGYSEIGGSVRFTDPTGHVFCLYEPSQESLTWSSGTKVREILADDDASALWQTVSDARRGDAL
ncbi:MAG TPA: VOC family protein [Pyrinomonadaceae bacterium]|nr:VOC family protein [Pyrinomonadaceae bacterium]